MRTLSATHSVSSDLCRRRAATQHAAQTGLLASVPDAVTARHCATRVANTPLLPCIASPCAATEHSAQADSYRTVSDAACSDSHLT